MKKSSLMILLIALTASIVLISGCSKDEGENPVTQTNVNHAPGTPSNPSPADSAFNIPTNVTLSWTCSDPDAGDTLRYDIYAGLTSPSTIVVQNILNNFYDWGLVPSNTTILWKVVAKDNNNAFTEGPVWYFTTGN